MNLLLNKVIRGRESAHFLEEMSQDEFLCRQTFCIEKTFIVSPFKPLSMCRALCLYRNVCNNFPFDTYTLQNHSDVLVNSQTVRPGLSINFFFLTSDSINYGGKMGS